MNYNVKWIPRRTRSATEHVHLEEFHGVLRGFQESTKELTGCPQEYPHKERLLGVHTGPT